VSGNSSVSSNSSTNSNSSSKSNPSSNSSAAGQSSSTPKNVGGDQMSDTKKNDVVKENKDVTAR
jgi:hypothetical protein